MVFRAWKIRYALIIMILFFILFIFLMRKCNAADKDT